MAKIEEKEAVQIGTMSQKEFAKNHGGISLSAINYLMDKDKLDYTVFGGRFRYVVLTDKTKAYKPNASKKRTGLESF